LFVVYFQTFNGKTNKNATSRWRSYAVKLALANQVGRASVVEILMQGHNLIYGHVIIAKANNLIENKF